MEKADGRFEQPSKQTLIMRWPWALAEALRYLQFNKVLNSPGTRLYKKPEEIIY